MKTYLYPLALTCRTGRAWIDDGCGARYPNVVLRVVRETPDGLIALQRAVKVGSRDHLDFIEAIEATIQ